MFIGAGLQDLVPLIRSNTVNVMGLETQARGGGGMLQTAWSGVCEGDVFSP